MKRPFNRIRLTFLAIALTTGVMASLTEDCKAQYYRNYLTLSEYYFTLYASTHITQYYYIATAYDLYYEAGATLDTVETYNDPYGYKSNYYAGQETLGFRNYEYFTALGDYYWRL